MEATSKILLADDDQEDFFIINEAFREIRFGGILEWVQNGEQVLDHLRQTKQLPGLIVLDLNMPLLNGTQTLKQLKGDDQFRHIPVVIFSTSINPIEKAECLQAGAYLYATKPNTYQDSLRIAEQFRDYCEGKTDKIAV